MFFFYKQKTAYEMRISAWSSDVCSSDLREVVQLVMDVDGRLEHGAIAILARRVMAGQIGAAKMLPCLLGFAQAEVSDQAIELADAQDVGRAGGFAFIR